MILTESIAKRLIALREKYNLSQSDIARQIGVTPALISAYENHILGRSAKIDNSVVISIEGLSNKQIEIVRDLISEFKNS